MAPAPGTESGLLRKLLPPSPLPVLLAIELSLEAVIVKRQELPERHLRLTEKKRLRDLHPMGGSLIICCFWFLQEVDS